MSKSPLNNSQISINIQCKRTCLHSHNDLFRFCDVTNGFEIVYFLLSFNFLSAPLHREIEACAHLLASLCSCLEQIMIIREHSEYGSLFPNGEHKAIGLFNTSAAVNQYVFYGRCIGFHVSVD